MLRSLRQGHRVPGLLSAARRGLPVLPASGSGALACCGRRL